MKELSIEEKAKAYDEAIERGKQIQNIPYTAHWDIMKEVTEYLLPALKESEDERIRKQIIEILEKDEERIGANVHLKKILWLKKQGEQKSITFNNAHAV